MGMISFHGKQEAPRFLIKKCLDAGFIRVDKNGGVFNRRGQMKGRSKVGYIVGTLHGFGIRRQVKAHQVVWIFHHGLWPDGMIIDHINREKSDNRIENLRLVSPAENSVNRRSYKGTQNPSAKINFLIAGKILEAHKKLKSYSKVSRWFGVSKSLVAKIVRREAWL